MITISENKKQHEAELILEARKQLKALMGAEPSLTQQALTAQIGVGKAVLSLWLNDNYTGDNLKVARKVETWLEQRAESQRVEATVAVPEDPGFYETPTAMNIIWPTLQYAQLRGSTALIYGGAGVCKSSTFREYEKRMPNVWRVGCTPATSRLSPFLSHSAMEMGVTTISSKPAIVEQAIVDKVSGAKGLLIVDDAQYLPVETLYQILWLRERAPMGILIAGNESIHGRMQAGFAQLYSRVGKRKRLYRPSEGDLDASLAAWEAHLKLKVGTLTQGSIRQFFLGSKSKPGPVKRDGGLRNVSETLALACFLASGAGDKIAAKHVSAAWNDISGNHNGKGGE